MKILLRLWLLCFVFLQGCSQGNTATKKDEEFKNYVNSNTQQEETTNQESKPIVNVAF